MSSRLRYLSSTSRAAGPGLVVGLGATAFVIAERLNLWHGDWWWGYNNLAQALPVLMVVTALAAGWQSGARGAGHAAQAERGPATMAKVNAGLVAAPGAGAVATYLLGALVVAIITIRFDGIVPRDAIVVIAAHVSMLALATAAGLAVGAIIPAPYSAPAAAALVGALLFVPPPGAESLLALVGPVAPVVGLRPSMAHHTAILLACLIATAALVWSASRRDRRRAPTLVAFGAAVATIGVASLVAPTAAFVDHGSTATRCASEPVQVCVHPGYDRIAEPAAEALSQLSRLAVARGVSPGALPRQFRQFGGDRPAVGVGTLSLSDAARRSNALSPHDLALSLSDPLWCSAMFASTPPVQLLDRRDGVYDWLLWLQGALPGEELEARHERFADADPSQWGALVGRDLLLLRECAN